MQIFFEEITLYSALWYILLYSVLGWMLEVVFCSANTGKFVNRGFLNGPVCPIYGFGGTAVILLLRPISHAFLPLFIGSVLITSLLELFTGFVLNKLFKTRWWDYSDQPFNIGGYVCLKFSLAWGVAGVVLMRVLHPTVAALVSWIPHILGIILLCIFYGIFIADAIVTVNAVMKLNRDLGELDKIAQELHKGSEQMAQSIGNKAIAAYDKIEELDLPEKMETGKERLLAGREKMEEKINSLHGNSSIRRRLVRAFPSMRHTRYSEQLEELKQKYHSLVKTKKKQDKNK